MTDTLPTRAQYLARVRAIVDTLPRVFDAASAASDSDDTYLGTHAARAARAPYSLPEHARTYQTIDSAKRDVTASGSRYFDADTLRFFRARTHPATTPNGLYAGRFWVESIQHVWTDVHTYERHTEARQYRVVWVEAPSGPDATVRSIGRLGDFATLREARRWARALADAVVAVDAAHVDYPHTAGHLYDCPVCEARCWCVTADDVPCVFGSEMVDSDVAHHGTREAREALAAREQGGM